MAMQIIERPLVQKQAPATTHSPTTATAPLQPAKPENTRPRMPLTGKVKDYQKWQREKALWEQRQKSKAYKIDEYGHRQEISF